MEIWLDTYDNQTITSACQLGILHGVTTNPSILANAKENHDKVIEKLLTLQNGPVAVQVTACRANEIVRQAKALQEISERIIVKIPVIQEGLAAIHMLFQQTTKMRIMATAVFTPNQALLAALAGADYVAPYFGRMLDEGLDALAILETMITIYKANGFKTKILAAALRTTDQITSCAALGIPAVTLKGKLYSEFVTNTQATLHSLREFAEQWDACEYETLPALV
jgi:TalC/MipB family fructose-6-phosphate aldolase